MVSMKLILPLVFSLFRCIIAVSPSASQPTPTRPSPTRPDLPRLIIYYQTTHDPRGRPISMLPLVHKQQIALTHLIVGAFHIHANHTIHLNDHAPDHPRYHTLWNETRILQAAGIRVLAMVGGAARGSFASSTLDSPDLNTFAKSYALLRQTIEAYTLDGVDIDVEEPMSQQGITRLVQRLHADFSSQGGGFIITLAPVATALLGKSATSLSGFDYATLEKQEGGKIGWYNAQFYNGFGNMGNTTLFDRIVAERWDPKRVVIGQLTSPENGGGFVRHRELGEIIKVLRGRYGEIGGVVGWEYFNGVPGGTGQPWRWAEVMTGILRPGRSAVLRITREMAEGLNLAWVVSAAAGMGKGAGMVGGPSMKEGAGGNVLGTTGRWAVLVPDVDYLSMINEK